MAGKECRLSRELFPASQSTVEEGRNWSYQPKKMKAMLLGPALPVPETLCWGGKRSSGRTRDYFMMNRLIFIISISICTEYVMGHRWTVLINILFLKVEASLQQGITKEKRQM